jgi:signal transduction histidine kinase
VVVLAVVIRPVDLSSEGALVNLISLGFAGTLGFGVRERRERHDADVAEAEHRADLERRLAEQERRRADAIAVEERLRLTRELHDVIGHALSVMVVQAGVAERMLERRPDEARLAVGRIARAGRDSLAEMRRLLEVMRQGDSTLVASRHPAPSVQDVGALVAEVRDAGYDVRVETSGDWADVPAGMQLAVYRIVQEALTNCLKHSTGRRVTVTLACGDDEVLVEVVDDGRPRADVQPGHGMTGMQERVGFYGGTLDAGPREGGFGIRAVLPVTREALPAASAADGSAT